MPTDVLIVRHGQSTWNALGRWQGHADPPLSELGERQASAAAASLKIEFDAIVASNLQRAYRTAELATGNRHEVKRHIEFRERDAGEWEGLTRVELDERWPNWQTTEWRPEGFEDDVAVLSRVLPALDRLIESVGRGARVLVVTHGGVIRALDRHHQMDSVPIPNLAGRWFHHDDATVAGEYVELASTVTDSKVE